MTTWRARCGKETDEGWRILCGMRDIDGARCPNVIATWPYRPQPRIALPDGLTDRGTPREYRWSSHSRQRLRRGERPDVDVRSRDGQLAGKMATIVDLPVALPCRAGHVNRVDLTDLLP